MTTYRSLDAPVRGGVLAAGVWDPEGRPTATVLAVHGITASHQAWPMVAGALDDMRVIAPDLRGRGHSATLPGPWGMNQHADDLARLLDRAGEDRVIVVGHSMGAFASVMFAHRHPDRLAGLLLVDGGLPLPAAESAEGDDSTLRRLGPAAQRLSMTFPSREAYREFWRGHPAFRDDFSDVVRNYVDYDLVGEAPTLRPSSSLEAVAADSLELHGHAEYLDALRALDFTIPFLRAPRGLLGEPEGLYPPDRIEYWRRELPHLAPRDVVGVNHYTILMSQLGVDAIVDAVRTIVPAPSPLGES
jgi:lipase